MKHLVVLASAPIIGCPATAHALSLAYLYALASNIAVLVGGTGTGKTYLARWMHTMGPRAGHPFVDVTAAEIPESLAQAALFGHEPGAFTGATRRGIGLLEQARDGTLLLDDFHLLPISVQAMLLRALSNRAFRPLGADRDLPLRCRVLVGLRECPDLLMQQGILLPDLRYRLGHCIIRLLPLAERREEIALLAELFLRECPDAIGVPGPVAFAPDVIPALEAAPWPGNVRDLRAAVEAAYVHAQGDELVRFEHLPEHARVAPRFTPHGDRQANARAIEWAMYRAHNRMDLAAELIGTHRNTISAYLSDRRHGHASSPAHRSRRRTVRGVAPESEPA